MRKQTEQKKNASSLRKKAEAKLRQLTSKPLYELSPSDSHNLINELQVHQIELEMQNEELRSAYQTLEESQNKFSDLYDYAPIGYITLDKRGRMLEVNLTFSKMLGIEKNRLIRKPFSTVIPNGFQDLFYHHHRKVLNTYKQQKCEIRLKREDGSEFDVQLETILVEDIKGDNVCRTSLIDITLRKLAEKERECATADLANTCRELEKILYIATHDLRAPLVNIEGFSEELHHSLKELMIIINKQDISSSARTRIIPVIEKDIPESLDYILHSIVKMKSLIKGIFDKSRTGESFLTIEDIDMNKMITDIIAVHQFRLNSAGVSIDISDLPGCKGDHAHLNQVFSNVLDNAIKYLRPEQGGSIKIRGHKQGALSVYSMEDNGIGIAPECLGRIFETFFQLDPENSDGEGIGLAIARRILDAHNGKIWVESEPGRGSRFFVSLPNKDTEFIN